MQINTPDHPLPFSKIQLIFWINKFRPSKYCSHLHIQNFQCSTLCEEQICSYYYQVPSCSTGTANIVYATVHLAWRNAPRHKQALFMMVKTKEQRESLVKDKRVKLFSATQCTSFDGQYAVTVLC